MHHRSATTVAAAVLVLSMGFIVATPTRASADAGVRIDPKTWSVIKGESGPVNYYKVETDPADQQTSYIRSHYTPPMKTTVLGYQVPDNDRRRISKVRWTWRAVVLPKGGDECASGKEDSAAVVYVTWKRGLKYYAIKYVWSSVGQKGKICDTKRNPFVAQDTVILETGAPTNTWRTEEIDLTSEFRRHFGNGDPNAEVPNFVGLGLMSDGDQTKSESSADYGTFFLER